jgi:hypothetical protein
MKHFSKENNFLEGGEDDDYHGVPKIRKVEARVKIKKQYRQSIQLVERFKPSTISWGFGYLTHGRVAKVTDLQFIGRGFESRFTFKVV